MRDFIEKHEPEIIIGAVFLACYVGKLLKVI